VLLKGLAVIETSNRILAYLPLQLIYNPHLATKGLTQLFGHAVHRTHDRYQLPHLRLGCANGEITCLKGQRLSLHAPQGFQKSRGDAPEHPERQEQNRAHPDKIRQKNSATGWSVPTRDPSDNHFATWLPTRYNGGTPLRRRQPGPHSEPFGNPFIRGSPTPPVAGFPVRAPQLNRAVGAAVEHRINDALGFTVRLNSGQRNAQGYSRIAGLYLEMMCQILGKAARAQVGAGY